jgi:hypothetical protein
LLVSQPIRRLIETETVMALKYMPQFEREPQPRGSESTYDRVPADLELRGQEAATIVKLIVSQRQPSASLRSKLPFRR